MHFTIAILYYTYTLEAYSFDFSRVQGLYNCSVEKYMSIYLHGCKFTSVASIVLWAYQLKHLFLYSMSEILLQYCMKLSLQHFDSKKTSY